jgi:AcrR family transcriptional regulator
VAGRDPGPSSRRDSRQALLDAARQLFAEVGYERATMRAVAARAGVDPALAYHYFDGKHGLLEAAVAPPAGAAQLMEPFSGPAGQAGEALVRRLLHLWDSDRLLREQGEALLRIGLGPDDTAAERFRDMQGAFTLAVVGDVMAGDQRELRAALIRAHVTGLFIARYMLKLPGLATAPHEALIATEGSVIQRYLTGPLPAPRAEDTPRAHTGPRR